MLTNDLKKTESDPYNWPASRSDLVSWGRLHKNVRDALVRDIKAAQGEADTETVAAAYQWVDDSDKYSELADPGLGFGMIGEWGPFAETGDIVRETVASAKEGRRLHELIRDQAGIEGEGVGGVTDNKPEEPSTLGTFFGGALLVAGGFAAWKFLKSDS